MVSGGPSVCGELGAASPEANLPADPSAKLAGVLAGDVADKACEMKLSALRLCAASVSVYACLFLVCAILT